MYKYYIFSSEFHLINSFISFDTVGDRVEEKMRLRTRKDETEDHIFYID